MNRKTEITRHVTEEELERLYLGERDVRMKERLHAVLLLYQGYQTKEVAEILCRGYARMTLKDVQVYVNTKYGVEYTYPSVWYWVRKKKKAPYGKPYPRDSRMPENAEEILKRLGQALEEVEGEPVIGFCDESAFCSAHHRKSGRDDSMAER